ncbi:MAG: hypothetical protein RLZZ601_242 [Pseudomonadota bacterium]
MNDSPTMSVRFPVTIDGVTKGALVTQETLHDHFGGNANPDLVGVFEANRTAIENMVRDLLIANPQAELIIKTNMF